MGAYYQILEKQVNWALNSGLELIGSKRDRGRPAYFKELARNLFQPLDTQTRQSFEAGDGKEISSTVESPAKMQAVHSSSALGVNIFQYWNKIQQVPAIAASCGFCSDSNKSSTSILFEKKFPIDSSRFRVPPNIDVVLFNSDTTNIKCYAVECKFTEAYTSRKHGGLHPKYLDLKEIWNDFSATHALAKSISPEDGRFIHLHAAQLVKHILGLTREYGKDGFKLLYLWYDAFGANGIRHRKEIDEIVNVVGQDGVHLHSMTFQELIFILSNRYRLEHPKYIKYITNRYL